MTTKSHSVNSNTHSCSYDEDGSSCDYRGGYCKVRYLIVFKERVTAPKIKQVHLCHIW